MRRTRQPRPATFFRGSEFLRMATMVVMLGVLYLLITRARDPNMWHWFAPQAKAPDAAAPPEIGVHVRDEHAPEGVPASIPSLDQPAPSEGPTDTDPEEQEAAREEFGAVTDKSPLAKEEMPAYWRLMGWERNQSARELLKRADASATFRDVYQRPEHYRGRLLTFPVHLNRTMPVKGVADNPLGITDLHEVFGWNNDSQPNWYWLVVPELPPGMPQGDIFEEGTFVGYFLKLIRYEDRQGKVQTAPLLIGRLIWHPAPDRRVAQREEWRWTFYGFAALASLFVLRWGLALWSRARGSSGTNLLAERRQARTVDDWLDEAESPPPEHDSEESADDWRGGPPNLN